MNIITVANQKGGVGKTTTAVTLAHGLALKHYNVLLIDLDPQGQCASLLGMEQEPCVFNLLVNRPPFRDVVRSTGRSELWLMPGNKRTATAQTILALEHYQVEVLKELLKDSINGDKIHYLVIDTAPAVGALQGSALFAADFLLIPSAVDYLALEGVTQILKTLQALHRPSPPKVRVLPTFYDDVTRESKTNLTRLEETFEALLLPPIHRAAILRECPSAGQTIFEYKADHRAAEEYAQLVIEVLDAHR